MNLSVKDDWGRNGSIIGISVTHRFKPLVDIWKSMTSD